MFLEFLKLSCKNKKTCLLSELNIAVMLLFGVIACFAGFEELKDSQKPFFKVNVMM